MPITTDGVDAKALENFMSELMEVETIDLQQFLSGTPNARLKALKELQKDQGFIQILREHKGDGVAEKFLRDSLGNQDKLINQLGGTLLATFISQPLHPEIQETNRPIREKTNPRPGMFDARSPDQMTLNEAKSILKNKPSDAKSYKQYVDVAHQFQNELKDEINNEYLVLAASSHSEAAKRVLTSDLSSRLTDAGLLGIYMTQANNDDFVSFALESTAINKNSLLTQLAENAEELFDVMAQSSPRLVNIYNSQAKRTLATVSDDMKADIKEMLKKNDPYTVLGIKKDATDAEIKSAFRKKSLSAHPDKGGSKEQFALVKKAYDILMDPNAKQYLTKKLAKKDAQTPKIPKATR